ncbi:MAG: class I SAM-dependent methyltransferase [Actinomycetota bacterium]
MPLDEARRANRSNWDDRVPIHWASPVYDVAGFIADPTRLSDVVAFDAPLVGEVRGRRLLHLQCHMGKDTLSWARLGAEVTGVDFSERAVAAAHRLSADSGTPGRFVVAELYDAPRVLPETFDVVYTGVGALNWLPDIGRWAEVVAGFLTPGGLFYIREGHPMLWSLDWRDDAALVVRYPYFETADSIVDDDPGTYAGPGTVAHARTYEWNHGLGEVVAALLEAGLVVTGLREHRDLEWQGLPQMTEGEDRRWRLPEAQRDLVPLMYSLWARKEG